MACDVLDANRGDCRRGPDDCGGCCLPSSLLSSSSVFAVFVGVQEVLLSDVDASLQRLATAAAAAATAAAAAATTTTTTTTNVVALLPQEIQQQQQQLLLLQLLLLPPWP